MNIDNPTKFSNNHILDYYRQFVPLKNLVNIVVREYESPRLNGYRVKADTDNGSYYDYMDEDGNFIE